MRRFDAYLAKHNSKPLLSVLRFIQLPEAASGGENRILIMVKSNRLSMLSNLLASAFHPIALLGLLALGLFSCQPASGPAEELAPLSAATVDTMKTRIVIQKSQYKLLLYEKDKLLRTYPVVLGFDPGPDKRMEGDGRTPEGTFHVRTKYPHASWSKFIWVDYPTAESEARFARRKAAREIPADAGIGGEIGIHGTPAGRDDLIVDKQNWTHGCISLKCRDVDELYGLIRTGTEIKILH